MAYDFDKKTCDECKAKKTGNETIETSFRLSYDGGVLCARCHKEKKLKELFELMDARERNKK